MVLLAPVDHRYRFRYTNVGLPGWSHDADVYGRSSLSRLVESEHSKRLAALIEGSSTNPL